MEHLDFILWMVLFPISVSICNYINEKKYKIFGEKEESSDNARLLTALFFILMWFGIGSKLF